MLTVLILKKISDTNLDVKSTPLLGEEVWKLVMCVTDYIDVK